MCYYRERERNIKGCDGVITNGLWNMGDNYRREGREWKICMMGWQLGFGKNGRVWLRVNRECYKESKGLWHGDNLGLKKGGVISCGRNICRDRRWLCGTFWWSAESVLITKYCDMMFAYPDNVDSWIHEDRSLWIQFPFILEELNHICHVCLPLQVEVTPLEWLK